jgi:hypothetical protein
MKKQLIILAFVLLPVPAFAATPAPAPAPVKHQTLHGQIGHQIVTGVKTVGSDVFTVGKQSFGVVKAVGSDVILSGKDLGHGFCAIGRASGRGLSDIGNHIQKVFTLKSASAPAAASAPQAAPALTLDGTN